jgi:hypothetical protein
MEETRKQKADRRTQREQAKVLRYAQASAVSTPAQPSADHLILVNEVPFRVVRGGSKLIRVSGMHRPKNSLSLRTGLPFIDDPNKANTTPKRVTVAGVAFVRSKNGNLHRLGAVTSKKSVQYLCTINTTLTHLRQPTAVKKRDELCKRFTTTGILFSKRTTRSALHTHSKTNQPTQERAIKDHPVFTFTTQAKWPSAKISFKQANAVPVRAAIYPTNHLPTGPLPVCISLEAAARTRNVVMPTSAPHPAHQYAIPLQPWATVKRAKLAQTVTCTSVQTTPIQASARRSGALCLTSTGRVRSARQQPRRRRPNAQTSLIRLVRKKSMTPLILTMSTLMSSMRSSLGERIAARCRGSRISSTSSPTTTDIVVVG